jgi:hypothetical protein
VGDATNRLVVASIDTFWKRDDSTHENALAHCAVSQMIFEFPLILSSDVGWSAALQTHVLASTVKELTEWFRGDGAPLLHGVHFPHRPKLKHDMDQLLAVWKEDLGGNMEPSLH